MTTEDLVLSDRSVPRQPLHEELHRMYSQNYLTDITLSTEDGKSYEAHKLVLAARSHYFHAVVPKMKNGSVIFLKGIKWVHLDKLLKFIYGGSVTVSRHQLKALLEVAKSLQVKGLQDASVTDILSRQNVVVSASRFKPDSPLGSPILSGGAASGSSSSSNVPTVDKTTLTNFRPAGKLRSSALSSSFASPAAGSEASKGASDRDSRAQNGSQSDEEAKEDSEDERVTTRATRKRGRGRPAKHKPKDKEKEDPYAFNENEDAEAKNADNQTEITTRKGWRNRQERLKERARGREANQEAENENEDSLSRNYSSSGDNTYSLRCRGQMAELHASRYVSGIRGECIKFKDKWMTPQDFEIACGGRGKKYFEAIETDFGPLKYLTVSGRLKTMSRKYSRREESPKVPEKKKKKATESEEEQEEDDEDDEDQEEEEEEEGEGEADEDEEEVEDEDDDEDQEEEEDDAIEELPQVTETEVQTDMTGLRHKKKKKDGNEDMASPPQIEKVTDGQINNLSSSSSSGSSAYGIAGGQHVGGASGGLLRPPTLTANILDNGGAKIAPPGQLVSVTNEQPMLYVMSPHPNITPQHTPAAFAPAMSPAPQLHAPTLHMPTVVTSIANTGPMKPPPAPAATPSPAPSPVQPSPVPGGNVPQISNVINVRCKAAQATLYTSKYESGSKGKCIQYKDEWLTPNEFEDRAGSKAKKYLSSIKCLGRPLRVFVNSGQLKGSGPPPTSKGPKVSRPPPVVKPSHPVTSHPPIAPAPPPAPSPAPIQAPPTPTHISSATNIQPNLNMMMGTATQQPILINPTSSMASTMLNQQHTILPANMTFTLATPGPAGPSASQAM